MATVERSLRVNITASSRGFSAGLKRADTRLGTFERRLIQANAAIAASSRDAAAGVGAMAPAIAGLNSQLGVAGRGATGASKGLDKTAVAARQASTQIASTTPMLARMGASSRIAGQHVGDLSKKSQDLAKHFSGPQGMGPMFSRTSAQMAGFGGSATKASAAVSGVGAATKRGARDVVAGTTAMAGGFGSVQKHSNAMMGDFENYAGFVGFQMLGRQAIVMGAAIAGALGLSVKAFADFEDSFALVEKTVDAPAAQLSLLSDEIRELSRNIPLAVEELNAVAGAAGQLGVPTEHIASFTETMAQMGVATNVTAEEASISMARIANVMQVGFGEDIDRMGASIVDLGNNFAAREDEIIRFTERIAAGGQVVGMTTSDILAFSTAFTSVGVKAERGGTAFQRVIFEMMGYVQKGGEELRLLAHTAGMTADQFAEAWRADPSMAVVDFIEGLGNAGEDANSIMVELFGNNSRTTQSFLSVAGAADLTRRAVLLGRDAWEENIALTNEAETRFSTLTNRLKVMANRVKDVAISYGEVLAPALERVASTVVAAFDMLGKLPAPLRELVGVLAGAAAAAAIAAGSMALMVFPMRVLTGMLPDLIMKHRLLFGAQLQVSTGARAVAGGAMTSTAALSALSTVLGRLLVGATLLWAAFKLGQTVWSRMQGDVLDTSNAAEQLALSMGNTLGNFQRLSSETEDGIVIDFVANNEELINTIAGMKDMADRKETLVEVGLEMILRGEDPTVVEESINKIIALSGVEVDLDVDFTDLGSQVDVLGSRLLGAVGLVTSLGSRFRITNEGARNEVSKTLKLIGNVAKEESGAARIAVENFFKAAADDMGAANVLGNMDFAFEGLFQGIAKNDTQARKLSDAFRNLHPEVFTTAAAMGEVEGNAYVLDQAFRAAANTAKDMGDPETVLRILALSGATDDSSNRLRVWATHAQHTKRAAEEGGEGVQGLALDMEELEAKASESEAALKSFLETVKLQTDAILAASDPLKRYGELIDAENERRKEAADSAAKAVKDGIGKEIDAIDDRVKSASKALDAEGKARKAALGDARGDDSARISSAKAAIDEEISARKEGLKDAADAEKDLLKERADNHEAHYEEITASREMFLQAQRDEIASQRAYYDNIGTIRDQYGDDVANFYLGLGPEYASLVAEMVAGGAEEVLEGFTNEMTLRRDQASELLAFVTTHGEDMVDEFGNINRDAVAAALTELGVMPGAIAEVLRLVDGAILSGGKIQSTTARVAGRQSVEAMKDGMQKERISLGQTVDGLVRDRDPQWTQMRLDAFAAGRKTVDGLVAGMDGRKSKFKTSISDYNRALTAGLNPILVGIGSAPIPFVTGSAFADGGMLPGQATIERPHGARGLVQWAESETEGEAFIPLAASKRARSLDIWQQTGHLLGAFAEGGLTKPPSMTQYGTAIGHTSKEAMDHTYGEATEWYEKNKAPDLGSAPGVDRMMAALRVPFPGLALNSGLRPGAITATGRPSYHGQGRAVDIPPRLDVNRWIYDNYKAQTKELIFSATGARQVNNGRDFMYKGITRKMHFDHNHWAMADGGIFNPHIRDKGGPLKPGYTFNGTGRNEMVLPMASGGITDFGSNHLGGPGIGIVDPAIIKIIESVGFSADAMSLAMEAATKTLKEWERQIAAAEAAARRSELAGALSAAGTTVSEARSEVKKAKDVDERKAAVEGLTRALEDQSSAVLALQRYDIDLARSNERAAVEARIAQMEIEEARRRTIEGNRESWLFDQMTTEEQIKNLNRRILAEEQWSDEWTSLTRERDALSQQVLDAEKSRIQELKQVRDDAHSRLISMIEEEASLRQRQSDLQKSQASTLEGLLKQAEDLTTRRTDLERDHSKSVRKIWADLRTAQDEAMKQRSDAVQSWARLDERVVVQWGNSVAAIVRNAADQTQQMAEFRKGMNDLRGRGLSEGVIEQLGLNDASSLGQVRIFLAATDAELADLNRSVAARTDEANKTAQDEAKNIATSLGSSLVEMRADANAAYKDLARDFNKSQSDLRNELNNIGLVSGMSYTEAIAKGLASGIPGIVAQTRVFMQEQMSLTKEIANIGQEQGMSLGQAIAAGMLSTVPAIMKAAAELSRARGDHATANKQHAAAVAKQQQTQATAVSQAQAQQGAVNASPLKTLPKSLQGAMPFTNAQGHIFLRLADGSWYQATGQGQANGVKSIYGSATLVPQHHIGAIKGSVQDLFGGAGGIEQYSQRTYDTGGVLPPGLTMAYNGTRQAEYVLKQSRNHSCGGTTQPAPVTVYHQTILDGKVVAENVTHHQQGADRLRMVRSGKSGWS